VKLVIAQIEEDTLSLEDLIEQLASAKKFLEDNHEVK
jgi:hypothetical protein